MRLLLSGAPQCVAADGSVTALALRDGALLAYLALEGPVPRGTLAALLWPNADATSARNTLRQRLFHLKRLLGRDLVSGGAELDLAADVQHDLHAASTLLSDAQPELGDALHHWLKQARGQLVARAKDVLAAQSAAAEASQQLAAALTHARAALALVPTDEALHCTVIRLLHALGDRAAALLAFDHCEHVLKVELGQSPSSATLALLSHIEAAEVPQRMRASTVLGLPVAVLRPPKLIGREAAWRQLQDAWQTGQVAVITAEAGMGKSRLVADFASVMPGLVVISARPGDVHGPYAVMSRLLRRLPAAALADLAPELRQELARLLPEWGASAAITMPEQRTRFFNAVVSTLKHVGLDLQGVVIDDLHFADEASIELLQFVVGSAQLRWLFTARAAEVSARGHAFLGDLLAHANAADLALAPLTLAQAQELLVSLALPVDNTESLAQQLLRRTGGNPFFMLETLRAWLLSDSSPVALHERALALPALHKVAELIGQRLTRLTPLALALAHCAALAAPDFSIALASQVLGVRTLNLADAWAELQAAQVFSDGGFAHDLVFEATLASVPQHVAQRYHASIAAQLVARQTQEPELAARLARHWLAAEEYEPALEALVKAAQHAKGAMRLLEQAALLSQAAALAEKLGHATQRFELQLQRLQAFELADKALIEDAALESLAACAQNADQTARYLLFRATVVLDRGEYEACLQWAEKAADQARSAGLTAVAVEATTRSAAAADFLGQSQRAVNLLRPSLPWVLEQAEPALRASFFNHFACCLSDADCPAESQLYFDLALPITVQLGQLDLAASICGNSTESLRNSGHFEKGLVMLARAKGFLTSYDSVQGQAWQADMMSLPVLRELARYDQALIAAEQAMLSAHQHPPVISIVQGHLCCLWTHLGQYSRARQALDEAQRLSQPARSRARRLQLEGRLRRAMGLGVGDTFAQAMALAPASGKTMIIGMVALDFALTEPADAALVRSMDVRTKAERLGYGGLALAATMRAAGFAATVGDSKLCETLAKALLATPADIEPDDMGRPELWLAAASAWDVAGRADLADDAAKRGATWLKQVAAKHLAPEFQESFLQRNRVNAALLQRASRGGN